jgi:hypothetical protein
VKQEGQKETVKTEGKKEKKKESNRITDEE